MFAIAGYTGIKNTLLRFTTEANFFSVKCFSHWLGTTGEAFRKQNALENNPRG
jgi:hypothetical protein